MKKISLKKFVKLLKKKFPYLVVKTNQYFRDYTTFKIGGKMGAFTQISDKATLLLVLRLIKKYAIPYFILGNGSNLLVSDKKINKFVIKVCLKDIAIRKNQIICGAGVNLFALNVFAMNNCLTNLEWSYGIPGSVGGAVKNNAGCFGKDMSQVVSCVYYTDGYKIYRRTTKQLDFSYRHSYFSDKNFVILRVVFDMKKGEKGQIFNLMQQIYQKRKDTQPYNYPSAGSVFKRIDNTPIPPLIEKCNLKGLIRGGAQISTKHCGFVVNYTGKAKFRDVFWLFCKIKKTIYKNFGIILEQEIEIVK